MYHPEGTNTLYVGGKAMVFILTFSDRGVRDLQVMPPLQRFWMILIPVESDDTAKATCMAKAAPPKLECDNFITVVQKVNDTFVVCGTNAGSPKCWLLVNETVLTDAQGSGQIGSPSDISPPYPSQKAISLTTDSGSLYSALSSVGGHAGSIRRTFGSQKLLKTENNQDCKTANIRLLLKDVCLQLHADPQFAGAAIIPSSAKYKEEIYFFFSEFNKTARVDEEPYRARIGRICTVDEGGIKPLLSDSWTTFMKARVMCGAGSTQQQYNNIRQAVVLTAQDKRAGVMYGLFSNPWGRTVICAYSIEDIDQAFATSKLRGYSSAFIGSRPGTCVRRNSSAGGHNDIKNLGIIRYHPEIEDVIRPVGVAPLDLPTDDQITHTVADIVLAVNDEHYSVLYLGTEQGKVLKVLHTSEEAFIIAQYSLFHNEGPVLNMAIDGQKGHLYVGTAMEVQRLPLADCGRYGDTCRDCILSRDPYCGWDRARRKCIPIPTGYNISSGALIQNLDQSNASVCGEAAALKQRRTSPRNVVVQSNSSVFLPCPVRSFHATYRWEKDNCNNNYPCFFSGDSCVLGPAAVDLPLKEGVFRCMATEDGFKVEVISYRLVYNAGPLAASLASTLGSSLLLAAATLWLL
ncbi:Semaphorin-7A [Merluccius polli]|uniref:Semaphorin-1A n=1 Tax=Merluccius polli TaxID=89951 RepID=A0AA47MRJ1_MERPO|nr:Semaphorin-7A [Merluccius polli]